MRFDIAVHFVAGNGTYQGQAIVSKRVPAGAIETVTLTLSAKHSSAAEAMEEANTHAELIRWSEPYRVLFDQIFTASER